MSTFFTAGCAEETDGEQGIEHTAVTNDAAAEQVPDRVEGQLSASGPPVATEWSNFVTLFMNIL